MEFTLKIRRKCMWVAQYFKFHVETEFLMRNHGIIPNALFPYNWHGPYVMHSCICKSKLFSYRSIGVRLGTLLARTLLSRLIISGLVIRRGHACYSRLKRTLETLLSVGKMRNEKKTHSEKTLFSSRWQEAKQKNSLGKDHVSRLQTHARDVRRRNKSPCTSFHVEAQTLRFR